MNKWDELWENQPMALWNHEYQEDSVTVEKWVDQVKTEGYRLQEICEARRMLIDALMRSIDSRDNIIKEQHKKLETIRHKIIETNKKYEGNRNIFVDLVSDIDELLKNE